MLIRSDHLFFNVGQYVTEIARPLRPLGITYFSYTRSYKNGERIYLLSASEVLENYFSHKHYLVGNSEASPERYLSQVVLWSTLPNQHLYEASKKFDVAHGMFLIEPNEDYCEFFGFGTTLNNSSIVNTYLSNMEFLKKFAFYFKEKAAPLLQQAETCKLILPFNKNQLEFISGPHEFDKMPRNLKLSKRQLECGRYLLQGKTIKEIGELVNLSPRTIEDYLNTLKQKLHCRNKSELIVSLMRVLNKH